MNSPYSNYLKITEIKISENLRATPAKKGSLKLKKIIFNNNKGHIKKIIKIQ